MSKSRSRSAGARAKEQEQEQEQEHEQEQGQEQGHAVSEAAVGWRRASGETSGRKALVERVGPVGVAVC